MPTYSRWCVKPSLRIPRNYLWNMWEYLFLWQKDWINAVGLDTILYATVTLQITMLLEQVLFDTYALLSSTCWRLFLMKGDQHSIGGHTKIITKLTSDTFIVKPVVFFFVSIWINHYNWDTLSQAKNLQELPDSLNYQATQAEKNWKLKIFIDLLLLV